MECKAWKVTSMILLGLVIFFIFMTIVGIKEQDKIDQQNSKINQLDNKCYYDACKNSYYYDYDAYEGMCYCYNEYGEQIDSEFYPYLRIK